MNFTPGSDGWRNIAITLNDEWSKRVIA
jgi:hypothetical protein